MVILERCLICRFFEGVRKKFALCPLDVLASGIGSLTNPGKLANSFKSERYTVCGIHGPVGEGECYRRTAGG